MTIYILQATYKGVLEPPRVFNTKKLAEIYKKKMELSSENYYIEIYEVELSLKMKSFNLI